MDIDLKRLSFMAVLTTIMLLAVQAVSILAIVMGSLAVTDYLAVWTPLLTMALGYWYGRGGAA